MGTIVKHIAQWKDPISHPAEFIYVKNKLNKEGVDREVVVNHLMKGTGLITPNGCFPWTMVFSDSHLKAQEIIKNHSRLFPNPVEELPEQEWDYWLNREDDDGLRIQGLMMFYKRWSDLLGKYSDIENFSDDEITLLTSLRFIHLGYSTERDYVALRDICVRIFEIQMKGEWSHVWGDVEHDVKDFIQKFTNFSLFKKHFKDFIEWQIVIANKVQEYANRVDFFHPDEFIVAIRDIQLTNDEMKKLSKTPEAVLFTQALEGGGDYSKMIEKRLSNFNRKHLCPV